MSVGLVGRVCQNIFHFLFSRFPFSHVVSQSVMDVYYISIRAIIQQPFNSTEEERTCILPRWEIYGLPVLERITFLRWFLLLLSYIRIGLLARVDTTFTYERACARFMCKIRTRGRMNVIQRWRRREEGRTLTKLKLNSLHGKASINSSLIPNIAAPIVPFNSQGSNPVKVSFVNVNDQSGNGDRICFNVGRELYFYIYKGVRKVAKHYAVLFIICMS
jgi:hypothetical protein